LRLAAETTHKSNKRKNEVLHPELESTLLGWVLQHEREGPVSGELLRENGRKLYALMYPNHVVPQWKFSNGWLSGFKRRHGIKEYKRHGESGSADMNAIELQRPEIAK